MSSAAQVARRPWIALSEGHVDDAGSAMPFDAHEDDCEFLAWSSWAIMYLVDLVLIVSMAFGFVDSDAALPLGLGHPVRMSARLRECRPYLQGAVR